MFYSEVLFDDGFGYVDFNINGIPECFLYSNQMLIVEGQFLMKRFKVEKIINSAQFTMDNSIPLERFNVKENLPGMINSLVFNGPFLDS